MEQLQSPQPTSGEPVLQTFRDRQGFSRAMGKPKTLDAIWKKHGSKWTSRWPWLLAIEEDGAVTGLGCSSCCQAPPRQAAQNAFATCSIRAPSAQTSVFENHEKSHCHKARCETLAADGGLALAAPSIREFADVLEAVFRGDGEVESCGPWKFRVMLYCLAEARRQQLRSRLQRSVCASLQQDVRASQLLVTFTSVDASLQTTSGVLGQVDLAEHFGFHAKEVFMGTVMVLNKFCCEGLGKPDRERSSAGSKLDHALVAHIKDVVELFAADAAPDEQRAGKLLQNYFPNLRLIQHDKAHAAQRILSRTFPTDSFLNQLITDLVTGPNAVTQKIRHSRIFSKRFREAVADLTPHAARRIRNLACAKHRWVSATLPFRRSVLYFRPLVRVAQSILDERGRSSCEGEAARTFLQRLSPQVALQLALIADATDETQSVSRFFDQDTYCKAPEPKNIYMCTYILHTHRHEHVHMHIHYI